MIIEICANSYESAIVAEEGGAHRIELCTNLSVGGLTPSFDLIERVIRESSIPVHVLVRPRPGDFCYTDEEIDIMLSTIRICKMAGCHGIVSGALTSNKEIDLITTKKLIDVSEPLKFIFHRAIDLVLDPIKAIEEMRKFNISGILSSGQKKYALQGLPLLKRMRSESKGMFEIMPGGGITPNDIIFFKNSGFKSVHLSAIKNKSKSNSQSFLSESNYEGVSDLDLIKEVVAISSSNL